MSFADDHYGIPRYRLSKSSKLSCISGSLYGPELRRSGRHIFGGSQVHRQPGSWRHSEKRKPAGVCGGFSEEQRIRVRRTAALQL